MKDKKASNLKEEKVQIIFYCPVAIRDELKRIAFEKDRNLGQQIVNALREWLFPHRLNDA